MKTRLRKALVLSQIALSLQFCEHSCLVSGVVVLMQIFMDVLYVACVSSAECSALKENVTTATQTSDSCVFLWGVLVRFQTPAGWWLVFNTRHTISHLVFLQYLVVHVPYVMKWVKK